MLILRSSTVIVNWRLLEYLQITLIRKRSEQEKMTGEFSVDISLPISATSSRIRWLPKKTNNIPPSGSTWVSCIGKVSCMKSFRLSPTVIWRLKCLSWLNSSMGALTRWSCISRWFLQEGKITVVRSQTLLAPIECCTSCFVILRKEERWTCTHNSFLFWPEIRWSYTARPERLCILSWYLI